MDIERIFDSAVRFSNFVSIRVLFFSAVFFLVGPSVGLNALTTDDVVNVVPIAAQTIETYKDAISALGIDDVAIYLLFFVLITLIHITYSLSVAIGSWLPPTFPFESLDSLEGVFRRRTLQALKETASNEELVSEMSEKLLGAHSTLRTEWEQRCNFSIELFSASKMLLVFVFSTLFLGLFGQPASIAASNRWLIFGVAAGTCILLGYRTIQIHRSRFSAAIFYMENIVEATIMPKMSKNEYQPFASEVHASRQGFSYHVDWNLPIFGSARTLASPIVTRLAKHVSGEDHTTPKT